MADLPIDVLMVYFALLIWTVLAVRDFKHHTYTATIVWGTLILLSLNIRYLIEGAPSGIAFFVSIYDLFDNLGLTAAESAPALATCPANECSLWGERYLNHSSWGVAFHDRFLNGPALRSNVLYGHLGMMSTVFVLMHVQLARPPSPSHKTMHKILGRVSFLLLTIATGCAVWLASEHDAVAEYGGALSKYGFWFMSTCVYFCAAMGVFAIRGGNAVSHRTWMIRFAGSMWGAFWIFRIMLLFTGPLLRNWESASILISVWFSAPIGIVIAEVLRRKWDKRDKIERSSPTNTTPLPT